MSDRANICRFNLVRLAAITCLMKLACEGCFCCSHGDAIQVVANHQHEHRVPLAESTFKTMSSRGDMTPSKADSVIIVRSA